jgi:hypothetical protein
MGAGMHSLTLAPRLGNICFVKNSYLVLIN